MNQKYSMQIVDRHGIVLRDVLSRQDAISRYAPLDSISPWLIHATLCSEDKRFFMHPGLDVLAMARALWQNVSRGRIVSGGSTITQQLARNMLGSPSRSLLYKCMEAGFALNIELKLSKYEILELYFNYAPYGNQTYGVEAASQLYFRKPARDLSLAEAVFLAALPQAPSWFNPYKHPDRIAGEIERILSAMRDQGCIDSSRYEHARDQVVAIIDRTQDFKAPHFCEFVLNKVRKEQQEQPMIVKTTLDYHIQQEIEAILKNHISRLSEANVTNGAAIVIEHQTMEILGYTGSVDFFDVLIDGEVDGVQALRQPGSALKPFTYALALEQGAHAATLIPDLPTFESTISGDYRPRNYDEKYHGMVRLRTALACSYNIPAVRVCGDLGPDMLLDRLHDLGFESLGKSPFYYGIGLTLGNGEVSLLELARAYSVLCHGGRLLNERAIECINDVRYPVDTPATRVFSPHIAYIISDIIADNHARSPAFGEYSPLNLPFFCAVKTGTSKDYRDNWCIGFTDRFLVGVWVGNFDGSPMHQVSGITGAAPVFRDILLTLHRDDAPGQPIAPHGLTHCMICTITGDKASEQCNNRMDEVFIPGTEPRKICQGHSIALPPYNRIPEQPQTEGPALSNFMIVFPDDQDIFKIDPILREEHQCLRLRITTTHALRHVTWYVDDMIIGTCTNPFSMLWQLSPGTHVIAAQGSTEHNTILHAPPVTITVLP
jgi:penicillin-binding protein 1C